HLLLERDADDCIIVAKWPEVSAFDKVVAGDFEYTKEIISAIRNFRTSKQIPTKESIGLKIKLNEEYNKNYDSIIIKICNIANLSYVDEKVLDSVSMVLG